MEPLFQYTYYDLTDISLNETNVKPRSNSNTSMSSDYSFFLFDEDMTNTFDTKSESTLSLTSLDEGSEKGGSGKFQSITVFKSNESLDSCGMKKTRSNSSISRNKTMKKRRSRDKVIIYDGEPNYASKRTPTPTMFHSLKEIYSHK